MAQYNGFGGLVDQFLNPTTMAGLSILGSFDRDPGAGFKVGIAASEDQRRAEAARRAAAGAGRGNAEDDAMKKAYEGLLSDPANLEGIPPQFQAVLKALPAKAGLGVLTDIMKNKATATGPEPTDDEREYKRAQEDPAFLDYLLKTKKPLVNMGEESKYDQKMGESLADEFINANKTAATANRDVANLNTMRKTLDDPNLYTGTGGNTVQALKKTAQTVFGVDVKGVSSGEVMQNITNEIAMNNRDKLPGPMSDSDRQFLIDSAPGIAKSPQGNKMLIELAMAHKEWAIAKAQLARKYAAEHGGRLDAGFYSVSSDLDQAASEKFNELMNGFKNLPEIAPRSPATGTPLEGGVEALKKKYGLD